MEYLSDQTSPLVKLVSAFEQLQRVEQRLFATTYSGAGLSFAQYEQQFVGVRDALEILRESEAHLRRNIVRMLDAVCREDV